MYAFDLRFGTDLKTVTGFLSALYRNGQAVGEWPVIVAEGPHLRCRVEVPAEDALDPSHDGPWVAEARKELGTLSATCFGRDMEGEETCGCQAPSARILVANWAAHEPPVRCGDCFGAVPLYRLPYLGTSEDQGGLGAWQKVFRSFDRLWFEGFAGEGYAYAQMSDPRSALARKGRGLCSELERAIGLPFYYFLMLYHGPDPESCPGCGKDWAWEDAVVSWIPHRCVPCRLVAQEGGHDGEIPDPGA